jgi:transcriptional regulator with XRE-family HTH domain
MYNDGISQYKIAIKYGVKQATIARIIKKHDDNWKPKRGKQIPQCEYNNIVNLYNNKMTQPEIAKLYNCSTSWISFILKENGVHARSGGSMNTESDVTEWVKMYNDGMTLKEIANICGTTRATVSKLLKDVGVFIDRYTYHFDEHYFDVIDTEEKAYILGLLWADGCNVVDKGSIILELQERDKDILETINNVTKNERPISLIPLKDKNDKWQNQYKLTWQSKYTSSVLDSLGMHKRKSLILEFPKWMHTDLHRHFIRGYLDGDGCISLSYDGKFANVSMVGTRMFLEFIQDIFYNNLSADVSVKRDLRAKDPICILRCNKKVDVMKILDWLYKDSTIYFERKYNKYQHFLENNKSINNSCLN